ncbi:tRNA cyclic N6-threonylcarbamoyladenosine(37) synthase TcdA [Oceanospirillum sanctuarii]|uniref:tRNA cyclic N6-threonylcarbamoyladenosine(37) synthase TcdA n=1 Tax=Oceanospirillum sanctuarii TaxID=1434821 RepID=UPI000A37807E|nr:tRNA cyclic N6-threonylcarbamoyladenosine(37) synthase TcdA [Oceanospirillum sanctuarii]
MNDDYGFRFGGISRLYGAVAAEAFAKAHVAVVGIGGVGSWGAEALARSGIGKITLIDLDDICTSNINRQIHAMDGQVGRPKVESMAERIKAINPTCEVNAISAFVTEKNVAELMLKEFDYVLDAIDSVKHKCAMIAYCRRNKIPLITIGGAGGQTDPLQIQIADLSKTEQDPLLAKTRNQLRRQYGFPTNLKRRFSVEAVYSTEQLVYPSDDGEVCHQKPDNGESTRLDCRSGFGAVTVVTGTFAFVAVSRILKKLAAKAQRQAEEKTKQAR